MRPTTDPTVIGNEKYRPYERPSLSKELLGDDSPFFAWPKAKPVGVTKLADKAINLQVLFQ